MTVVGDCTTKSGLDIEVFRRYAGLSLPRHVSYPMPTWWSAMSADETSAMHASAIAQQPGYDLSLYLHLPFCETLCKFCACNKIILRKEVEGADHSVDLYLEALETEIKRLANSIDAQRPLRHIHWGGGSPTYLESDQIERVHRAIVDAFNLESDAEVAMEVDPRHVDFDKLKELRRIGFNRVSMGVQDFDLQVQQHVRRIQPFDMVRDVVTACRELQFDSVNFDLIYGMPYQTADTIRDTVEKTIELSPDRIAYYHYAQIPEKIATQRGMDYTKLPDSVDKLEMFLIGMEHFEQAGYDFVGLDHFAKPEESLSQGLDDGTTQRNFQGMTTGGGLRLLGVGVSAISHLTDVGFLQNVKDIHEYVTRLKQGQTPVQRGKRLTADDRIRQFLINQLYCLAEIRPSVIEEKFDLDFPGYFARELEICEALSGDGLLTIGSDHVIRLTSPLGRVLMRNVAAVFDVYLGEQAYIKGEQACYSINA